MRARRIRLCSEIPTYGGFHENLYTFSGTRGSLISLASHERDVLAYRKLCIDHLHRVVGRFIGEMNRAVSEPRKKPSAKTDCHTAKSTVREKSIAQTQRSGMKPAAMRADIAASELGCAGFVIA